MKKESSIDYIRRNRSLLSLRVIANRIGVDVSNFHKVINGTLGLKEDKSQELDEIISELRGRSKK